MGAPSSQAGCTNDDEDLKKMPQNSDSSSSTLSTYLSLIQQYLAVFMVDNATFLAERCVAEHPGNPEATYMLALCYYRAGSPKRARQILEPALPNATGSMRYLAAQCSYDLQDYGRAEEVLLRECRLEYQKLRKDGKEEQSVAAMDDWIMQTTPCPIPNGAAGLALMGKICRKSNRKKQAIKYFKMSLQLDPFLWTSFEALAELGVTDYGPVAAFGVASSSSVDNSILKQKMPLQTVETPAAQKQQSFAAASSSVLRTRSVHFETPGLTPIPASNSLLLPTETPQSNTIATTSQNPNVLRRARDVAARQYYPPSPETPVTHVTRSMRYLRGLGVHETMSATYAADSNEGRTLFLTSSSENQASNQSEVAKNNNDDSEPEKPDKEPEQIQSILGVLSIAGAAYQRLCNYNCRDALHLLQTLPLRQQTTGWVLHQQGRAFLEMNDFRNAQRCLELMQKRDPGRMKGLELLSTVYWQLKKEVELAHLAQRVVDMDRLSPEAWCVVGNCFSLQKDHESALLFFKRSLQLDNDFTYTHTLSGYEYMANEDFEKAITCFRQALRIDERHYNAWYGLGAIYHRQEKFDQAVYHFQKAVQIHPSSSVLRCNLGIAQHANGDHMQALETLSGAFQLDPHNPQARFQRATIFSSLNRPLEALAELEKVRDAAPREATVHFAMGKVLKRLGRPEEAMKCFLTAMDLDPKDNQMIKSAMDKLDEPEVDEDNMAAF